MAEDSPPPSEDQQSRGRSLNPGRSQQINRVEVTRMDVQTGEIKELQTDLLSEICDCIDEQTVTLGKKFDQLQREIVKALERQRKDRAKGGGGKGGDGVKAQEAAVKALKKWTDTVKVATDDQGMSSKQFKALTKETKALNKGLGSLRITTALFLQSIPRLFKAFTENLELTKTGLFDLTDSIKDVGALFREGRLSTIESFKAMKEAVDRGAAPAIGILGKDLQAVGFELAQFQEKVRDFGFDFESSMDFREMSAATIQLLDIERRKGIQANIRDVETRQNLGAQLSLLQDISSLTGKTVDELVKLTQEEAKSFAELRRAGRINKQQEVIFTGLSRTLKSLGNEPAANLVAQVAKAGGLALAVKDDPALRILVQQAPQLFKFFDAIENDTALGNRFAADQTGTLLEMLDELKEMSPSIRGLDPASGGILDPDNKIGGFAGALDAMVSGEEARSVIAAREEDRDKDKIGTRLDETIRLLERVWDNNVPHLVQEGLHTVGILLARIIAEIASSVTGIVTGVVTGIATVITGKGVVSAATGAGGRAAATTAATAATGAAAGGGLFASLKSFGGKALSGAKSLGGKALSFGGKALTRVVAPISAGLAGVELGKWMEEQFGVGTAIGRLPELFGLNESIGTAIFEIEQWARKGLGFKGGAGLTDVLESARGAFGNLFEWISPIGADGVQTVGPSKSFDTAQKPKSEQTNEELVAGMTKVSNGLERLIGLGEEANIINDKSRKAIEAGDIKTGIVEIYRTMKAQGFAEEEINTFFSEARGVGG